MDILDDKYSCYTFSQYKPNGEQNRISIREMMSNLQHWLLKIVEQITTFISNQCLKITRFVLPYPERYKHCYDHPEKMINELLVQDSTIPGLLASRIYPIRNFNQSKDYVIYILHENQYNLQFKSIVDIWYQVIDYFGFGGYLHSGKIYSSVLTSTTLTNDLQLKKFYRAFDLNY